MADLGPDRLTLFLRRAVRQRSDWREGCCLGLAADWLMTCGYPDPTAPWRGRWTDEVSARALVVESGGLTALMREAAARVDLMPTHAVRRGDVGAIDITGPDGIETAAGLWTGARWVVRAPRGLWGGTAPVRAAWRVEV